MFVSIFPLLVRSMHSYSSALQFTIFFILIWRTPLSIFFFFCKAGVVVTNSLHFCFLAYFVFCLSFSLFFSFILKKIIFSGKMLIHRFLFLLLFFFLWHFEICHFTLSWPTRFLLRNTLSLTERWECGAYIW